MVVSDEVLRAAWRSDPTSLDPQRGSSAFETTILWALYDALIDFEPETLEPRPGLAESWDQSDPSVLTLQLREGVVFHDGTPFNAEAVKFNLERAAAEGSNIAPDVSRIASIEVLGEYEVQLNLSEPDTSLLMTLSDRAGMMISPTAAEAAGDSFELEPVGTGPFKFVEYRAGEIVRVERFDDYWQDGKPYIGGIDFNIILDQSTAVNALRSGQQDIAVSVPFQEVAALQEDRNLEVVITPAMAFNVLYINSAFAPFDDVRVREAVNYAIDRTELVETTLFGFGEEAWSMLPSNHWAGNPDLVDAYPFDQERARKLLADAGYSDGLSIQMSVFTSPIDVRRAEILKDQLADVGIDVELVVNELNVGIQAFLTDKKFPIGLAGGIVRPDPALAFRVMFDPSSQYNPGEVAIDGLAVALAAPNGTSDIDERSEHLREAQQVIRDNSAFVPLVRPSAIAVMGPRVKGHTPNLQDKPSFNNIWLAP
jgi:peptide/nickel transport system permease protein/peptide/nickel transport system substrate-binding protein